MQTFWHVSLQQVINLWWNLSDRAGGKRVGVEGAAKWNNSRQRRKQGDGVKGWSHVQVGAGLSALFFWLSLSTSDKTKLKRFTQRMPWALHFIGELWRPWESKFRLFSRFLKAAICFNVHFFSSSTLRALATLLSAMFFFNLPFDTSSCSSSHWWFLLSPDS